MLINLIIAYSFCFNDIVEWKRKIKKNFEQYLSARSKSSHSESTNSTFSSPNSSSYLARSKDLLFFTSLFFSLTSIALLLLLLPWVCFCVLSILKKLFNSNFTIPLNSIYIFRFCLFPFISFREHNFRWFYHRHWILFFLVYTKINILWKMFFIEKKNSLFRSIAIYLNEFIKCTVQSLTLLQRPFSTKRE